MTGSRHFLFLLGHPTYWMRWLKINYAECWVLTTFILSGTWNGWVVLSMPMIASQPLSPRSYFPSFVYVIERVFGPFLSSKYKWVLFYAIIEKWCNCEKSCQICFFWTPKVLKYGLLVYQVHHGSLSPIVDDMFPSFPCSWKYLKNMKKASLRTSNI